jgi:hypothetical protein
MSSSGACVLREGVGVRGGGGGQSEGACWGSVSAGTGKCQAHQALQGQVVIRDLEGGG